MGDKLQEFLAQMTTKQALLLSCGVVFLYYVLFYDDGAAVEKKITTAKQKEKEVKGKIKKGKKRIADAKKFLEVREELGEKMDVVLNYIPIKLSLKEFRKSISGVAQVVGVGISDIGEGKAVELDNGFLERVDLTVKLTGSFSQLMLFLSDLTKMRRVVTTENLSLVRTSQGGSGDPIVLAFTAVLSTYRYVNKDKE